MQTNGLTERFNQTLSRCLAKVVNNEHSNWDEKIDTVLMGYRASKQASTKHSPYYMLYQKPMQLPIDAELCQHDGEAEEEDVDIDEIIDNLLERRQQAFSKAKDNIDEAQKKQKLQYDVKRSSEAFPIGTEVLVENTADKQRKGGKLNRVWFGPYTISRFIGKGVYELSNEKGNVVRNKVNVNRLKRYVRRSDDMDGMSEDKKEIDGNYVGVNDTENGSTGKEKQFTIKGRKRKFERNDKPPPKKHCSKTGGLIQDILCGEELTDEHMTFASKLLEERFPCIGGMQSSLLAQNHGFIPVLKEEDSVQFHHTGQFHWVASALLKGKVYVYDSCFSGVPISSSMQVQLSLVYKSILQPCGQGKKTLAIEYPGVDCGVFAIAFAFHAGK